MARTIGHTKAAEQAAIPPAKQLIPFSFFHHASRMPPSPPTPPRTASRSGSCRGNTRDGTMLPAHASAAGGGVRLRAHDAGAAHAARATQPRWGLSQPQPQPGLWPVTKTVTVPCPHRHRHRHTARPRHKSTRRARSRRSGDRRMAATAGCTAETETVPDAPCEYDGAGPAPAGSAPNVNAAYNEHPLLHGGRHGGKGSWDFSRRVWPPQHHRRQPGRVRPPAVAARQAHRAGWRPRWGTRG